MTQRQQLRSYDSHCRFGNGEDSAPVWRMLVPLGERFDIIDGVYRGVVESRLEQFQREAERRRDRRATR